MEILDRPVVLVEHKPFDPQKRRAGLDLKKGGDDRIGKLGRDRLIGRGNPDAGALQQQQQRLVGHLPLVAMAANLLGQVGCQMRERHILVVAHAYSALDPRARTELELLCHERRRRQIVKLNQLDLRAQAHGHQVLEDSAQIGRDRLRRLGLLGKRATTARTADEPFLLEPVERAPDGDSRNLEDLRQFVFRRQGFVAFELPLLDLLAQDDIDLVVQWRDRVVGQDFSEHRVSSDFACYIVMPLQRAHCKRVRPQVRLHGRTLWLQCAWRYVMPSLAKLVNSLILL